MTTGKALNGKPYAGNPHVRFDEGEVASAVTPRRGSLLYRKYTWKAAISAAAIAAGAMAAFAATNITENVTLTEDTDWTEFGTVTLAAGATVNLNGHSLAVKNIDGAGAIADIPGYQRLEYIESTGSQYINTGYLHNKDTKVLIRVEFTKVTGYSNGYCVFYGARSSDRKTQLGGWLHNGKFMEACDDSASDTSLAATVGTIYDAELAKTGSYGVSNLATGAYTTLGSGNGFATSPIQNGTPQTDYIFAIHQDGYTAWWCNMKCYGCKVWEGTTLVRDFVPVRRMEDDVLGMWDNVESKFYENSGSGKFLAGPAKSKLRLGCGDNGYAYDFSTSTLDVDAGIPVSFMESGSLAADCDMRKFQDLEIEAGATIDLAGHKLYVSSVSGSGTITDSVGTALSGYERIEYLQSSGSQYINTGYLHNKDTKVLIRVEFTKVTGYSNGYCVFYGARSSDRKTQLGGWLHNGKFMEACDDSASDTSLAATVGTIYDAELAKTGSYGVSNLATGAYTTLGSGNGFATSPIQNGTPQTDYIFAIHQDGKTEWWCNMKCYGCKVWEGTTLVRDFVPVRRTSDGVLGLLDLAHGNFYTNAGSGSFSAGETIVDVVGGELHVVVADGETGFCNVALTGGLKVVKEGEGTLLMDKASQTYFGGTEIAAGVLKSGAGLAQPCGVAGGWIVADASGMVDFNGNANMQSYRYDFADGAKALNGGAAISSGAFTFTSFYTPVSTGAFTASLADAATLDLTEWNGAWPIANVTAPIGATVTVKVDMDAEGFRTLATSKDAETGKNNGKLLSFDGARPADTIFVPDAVSANRCRFIADENGDIILTFREGFVIIIK